MSHRPTPGQIYRSYKNHYRGFTDERSSFDQNVQMLMAVEQQLIVGGFPFVNLMKRFTKDAVRNAAKWCTMAFGSDSFCFIGVTFYFNDLEQAEKFEETWG